MLKPAPLQADNSGMRDTVDYRLLDRFRAYRRQNVDPTEPQSEPKRAAAAADGQLTVDSRRRVRALDLRD